jgi:hypothetical protein
MGGRAISDRWEHVPPSPRAEGAAVELVPKAGVNRPPPGHQRRCQQAPQRR